MRDLGIVEMSKELAVPLVVGKDTVYVHTDIKEIDKTDEMTKETYKAWQAHEVQYDKNEFIEMIASKNKSLDEMMATHEDLMQSLILQLYM